jgi:fructoselysine-6-P-deglycase FrlB-like protein
MEKFNFNEKLLEKNKQSEICSIYSAADNIERSLEENKELIKKLAKEIYNYNPEQILFVGSGASYCTLYTGYYFLRTNSLIRAMHAFGPEILSDNCLCLEKSRTFAILSSYSGKTEDTLLASRFLKQKNIPILALTKSEDTPLAQSADFVLAYHDKCLYTSAMANLLMLLSNYMILNDETKNAINLQSALLKIPEDIRKIQAPSEEKALVFLDKVKEDNFFYVLGDGALWALAYQFGYTNLTEYSRVHAACLRSCEWRHGPLEVLFRKPAMIMFIGNDASRPWAITTKNYCEKNGANIITFDVEDYVNTHPVLAPFILHQVSQFFFLYQSTYRGIDMDDYLEMHVKPYKPGENYF